MPSARQHESVQIRRARSTHRLRHSLAVESHDDAASGLAADGDIEENLVRHLRSRHRRSERRHQHRLDWQHDRHVTLGVLTFRPACRDGLGVLVFTAPSPPAAPRPAGLQARSPALCTR